MRVPAKMVEGQQGVYGRVAFVIFPNQAYLEALIKDDPELAKYREALEEPEVYTTELSPFEGDLEGWSPTIKRMTITLFLEDKVEELPRSLQKELNEMADDPEAFFKRWWTIKRCSITEILRGSWRPDAH